MLNQLESLLNVIHQEYYRLVIVLGLPGSGKTELLLKLSELPHRCYLNINFELSKRLMNHPSKEHPKQVIKIMEQLKAENSGSILLCDNIEILFDPTFNLNVLDIFKQLSRFETFVVAWTGRTVNDQLVFNELGHWGSSEEYDAKGIKKLNLNSDGNEV